MEGLRSEVLSAEDPLGSSRGPRTRRWAWGGGGDPGSPLLGARRHSEKRTITRILGWK